MTNVTHRTTHELVTVSSPACSPQYRMTIPAGTLCERIGESFVVYETSKVIGGNAHDLEHYYIFVNPSDVEVLP